MEHIVEPFYSSGVKPIIYYTGGTLKRQRPKNRPEKPVLK